jgi:hypothetical protein
MLARIRNGLSFANVCSFLALVIATSAGGAYAASTITSADIVDRTIKARDIGRGAVTGDKILDRTINTLDVARGGLLGDNIRDGSITMAQIAGGMAAQNIELEQGEFPIGECVNRDLHIDGFLPGQSAFVAFREPPPPGILFFGNNIAVENVVTISMCNFSGQQSPPVGRLGIFVLVFNVTEEEPPATTRHAATR